MLTSRQKMAVMFLVLLMSIAGVMELIAVSAVPIFLSVLSGGGNDSGVLEIYERYIGDLDYGSDTFLYDTCILFFLIVLTKNIFSFITNTAKLYLAKRIQWHLTYKICIAYVRSSYEFHMTHDASELLRNANVETQKIANAVILPFTTIVMSMISLLFVTLALILFDPLITIIVLLVTSVFSVIYYYMLRAKITDYAVLAQEERARFIKLFNMTLKSIPEIHIHKKENYFLNRLSKSAKNTADYQRFHLIGTLSSVPYLETVAMGSIMIISIYMLKVGENTDDILATLGLVSVAIIRIRSFIASILGSLTQIAANHVAVEPIYEHYKLLHQNEKVDTIKFNNVEAVKSDTIVLNNVEYTYPDSEVAALKNISFKVNRGMFIGITGESGSGKTTLVKLLLGLLKPGSGYMSGFGENIISNITSWQDRVAYVSQDVYLLDDTIRNNVAFGVEEENINDDKVRSALDRAQLSSFIQKLPNGIDSIVGDYGSKISGGEKQRVGIARALYIDPEVLILDEVTSSLDADTENRLISEISNLKGECIIFFVTHKDNLMRVCDVELKMESGTLQISNCLTNSV